MNPNEDTIDETTVDDMDTDIIDEEENPSRLIKILPNDVSKLVINYLPAYRFVGRQGMPLLSKMWEKEDKEEKSKVKRKISEVLASCQTPEDALNILSDDSLYDQFKMEELLAITAFHPDLTKRLLANSLLIEDLEPKKLSILGSQCEDIALEILKARRLLLKLSAEDITYLGTKSKKTAQVILSDEKLYGKLNGDNLVTLGSSHEDLALIILKDTNLKSKLSRMQFVKLNSYFENLALDLLKTELANNNINSDFLYTLGEKNLKIARIIFNNKTLISKLSPYQYEKLIAAHKDIALRWFEKYKEKLNADTLTMFAKEYESIALIVLKDPQLRSKLLTYHMQDIGKAHEKAALEIFNIFSTKIKEINNFFFFDFGITHEIIAQMIFEDRALYNLVRAETLSRIGSCFEKIAKALLQDEKFCHKLNGVNLAILIKNHRKLIHHVLETPQLRSILKKASIKYIADGVSPRSAKVILGNSDLRNMFTLKLQSKFKLLVNMSEYLHALAKELKFTQSDENLHNNNHKHEREPTIERAAKRPK